MVMGQVPADGVGAGVQAGLVEPRAQPQDQLNGLGRVAPGLVFGARESGSNAASSSTR
jgi:hypothetical protein